MSQLRTFQSYIPIYDGDRYCLMCRHACPVGRVTKREATTPHGWALLVASVNRGMMQWDADVVDTLYQCADCGLCQGNCATDRPLPYAIVAARAEIVRQDALPASVRAVEEMLRTADSRRQRTDDRQSNTRAVFIGNLEAQESFVTAARRALNAVGLNAASIAIGHPSVYLAYTLGLWDRACALARRTLDEISAVGANEIVTLSAEDTHTFVHIFPELGMALPGNIRVTDIVELLAAKLEQGQLRVNARALKGFTYHDACQAVRLPGRDEAARKMIRALTGTAPREMLFRQKLATPCGAVGGLEFTQPRLAEKLARTRIAEARATGAEILLTDDPRCATQLKKYADGIQVLNWFELLAEQIA